MSGGTAYVLDLHETRLNSEMVDRETLDPEDIELVRHLVGRHVETTDSAVGTALLDAWRADPDATAARFAKIMPRDYKASIGGKIREEWCRADGFDFQSQYSPRQSSTPDLIAGASSGGRIAAQAVERQAVHLRWTVCKCNQTHFRDRETSKWMAQICRIVARCMVVKAIMPVQLLIWSYRWPTRPPTCAPQIPLTVFRFGLAQFSH